MIWPGLWGGKRGGTSEGRVENGGMDVWCGVAGWSSRWRAEGETRVRGHGLGTTAGQVAMVWACAARGGQWLGGG